MELSVLNYEFVDGVAVVTMNSPPVNALGIPFLEDFTEVLGKIRDTGEARAVLIASACSGFFSAGDDVSSLKEIDQELFDALPKAHALLNDLEALPLPTVAAINGHALGGGLELALACDFRFMGEDSGRIGLPEVRLGLIPSLAGTQRLPLLVGKAKAVEMMFKGLQLTPREAERIGLVNEVFSQEELYAKSLDYTTRLARQATRAIARIKRCVNTGLKEGFAHGLAAEHEAFRENIVEPDAREGVAAFLEGRKAVFKGVAS
jgi:enoyl-CoA hydratase/carnithine racemase